MHLLHSVMGVIHDHGRFNGDKSVIAGGAIYRVYTLVIAALRLYQCALVSELTDTNLFDNIKDVSYCLISIFIDLCHIYMVVGFSFIDRCDNDLRSLFSRVMRLH